MHRNSPVFKRAEISLMEQNLSDIFDIVEHAIDYAFEGQMNLKFYDFLKANKTKKHEVDMFIHSMNCVTYIFFGLKTLWHFIHP